MEWPARITGSAMPSAVTRALQPTPPAVDQDEGRLRALGEGALNEDPFVGRGAQRRQHDHRALGGAGPEQLPGKLPKWDTFSHVHQRG